MTLPSDQYTTYRTVEGSLYPREPSAALSLAPLCLGQFVPCLVFATVCTAFSTSLHHDQPKVCCIFLVGVMLLVLLPSVCFAYRGKSEDKRNWATFIATTTLLAAFLAVVSGFTNYLSIMRPYYNLASLNTYPGVNPERMRGEELMDAGIVTFTEKAHLDLHRSAGFKKEDMYCAVPITTGEGPEGPASYDFWAIGTNCCSGEANSFQCDSFDKPHARTALRVLEDDDLRFYHLAVRRAEESHSIKARRPLFFRWLEDPTETLRAWRSRGQQFVMCAILVHFGFQAILVTAIVMSSAKNKATITM